MAGSISLSLSQQFDEYGKPLSGGLLYTIQAGTTATPQNSFKDYGLSIVHPNPIILDAAGRVPAFYLADGQIKIRLTDKNGVDQIVQDNLLVIGPSSGGGGGGGIDPTTVFQTGDVMWLDVQGSRAGWVRDNGRTIGSATSGATERANADCEALFNWLWNHYDNTFCPVSTGRGASSIADWAANKTIQLRNKQNCVQGGLDDMGAAAAGGYANVPIVSGGVTTASSVIGESLHQLTGDELAQHDHTVFLHDPQHAHVDNANPFRTQSNAIGSGGPPTSYTNNLGSQLTWSTATASTGVTLWSDGDNAGTQNKVGKTGNNTAHNNVQKTVLGTFYRKL